MFQTESDGSGTVNDARICKLVVKTFEMFHSKYTCFVPALFICYTQLLYKLVRGNGRVRHMIFRKHLQILAIKITDKISNVYVQVRERMRSLPTIHCNIPLPKASVTKTGVISFVQLTKAIPPELRDELNYVREQHN